VSTEFSFNTYLQEHSEKLFEIGVFQLFMEGFDPKLLDFFSKNPRKLKKFSKGEGDFALKTLPLGSYQFDVNFYFSRCSYKINSLCLSQIVNHVKIN